MNDRIARIIVLALAIGFAISPLFSDGFGGFYRESFPVQVDRWPAQPAGWAFSIWGLIYVSLILSAAWALWRPLATPRWREGAAPLGFSLLLGIFWIEAARLSPPLAVAIIVPMTATAILAMWRVGNDWSEWAALGLYAGWLTAASGVAISVVLTGYGILSPRVAAITLILGVLMVGVGIATKRRKFWTYRAGVIWALIGIMAVNLSAEDWLIVTICAIGAITLCVFDRVIPARDRLG